MQLVRCWTIDESFTRCALNSRWSHCRFFARGWNCHLLIFNQHQQIVSHSPYLLLRCRGSKLLHKQTAFIVEKTIERHANASFLWFSNLELYSKLKSAVRDLIVANKAQLCRNLEDLKHRLSLRVPTEWWCRWVTLPPESCILKTKLFTC